MAGLPENAQMVAEQSLAGALAVTQKLGPEGEPLVHAAKEAWMSGYHYSLLVSAALIALASIIAFRKLPDRSADHIPEEGNFDASES